MERLVQEAGVVDERAQLVGEGALAGDLVLQRAAEKKQQRAGSLRRGRRSQVAVALQQCRKMSG